MALLCALVPTAAQASHFRYGHMTWKRTAPNSRTVEFTITGAWRINAVDNHVLRFGDGTQQGLSPTILTTATDAQGEGYA
ncbi:MAG TPA: hypothetical protein VLQ93_16800, partial [Myxococcaceae bacterium]|nr:hypothetical protein [Myxococcaceae bacterium]